MRAPPRPRAAPRTPHERRRPPTARVTAASARTLLPPRLCVASALHCAGIDSNLYRSTRLWRPDPRARAVYGGVVIAQALAACARTVDPAVFVVHSLHSYFILPGDHRVPILYHVRRLRDGRSFVTRMCVASQGGKDIFSVMVSFHRRDEPSPLEHQRPMPLEDPRPEELPDEKAMYRSMLADERLPEPYHSELEARLQRPESALDVRYGLGEDWLDLGPKPPRRLVWLRTRGAMAMMTATKEHGAAAGGGAAGGGGGGGSGGGGASARAKGGALDRAARAAQEVDDFSLAGTEALHQCVAAFASDWSLLATAMFPHGWPNPLVRCVGQRVSLVSSVECRVSGSLCLAGKTRCRACFDWRDAHSRNSSRSGHAFSQFV